MKQLLCALLAMACARPPGPQAPATLVVGKEDQAYLAADEVRLLSLDSPGGPLLVTCGITGEGSYARVEVRSATDVLGRGTCGDRIRIADAPAGSLGVSVRAFGGPGALRLLADRARLDPDSAASPSGDPPEGALAAALQKRDEPALDALLMDDFTAHIGGESLDKRAFLEKVRREPPADVEPRDLLFRVHGQTALATLALGGTTVTDTWVSDGGRWRLLARQQ